MLRFVSIRTRNALLCGRAQAVMMLPSSSRASSQRHLTSAALEGSPLEANNNMDPHPSPVEHRPEGGATAGADGGQAHSREELRRAKKERRRNKSREKRNIPGANGEDDAQTHHHHASLVQPRPAQPTKNCIPTRVAALDTPHAYTSFRGATPLHDFRQAHSHFGPGEHADADTTPLVRVGGRVISVRDMGKILFITIRSGHEQLQLIRQVSASVTKAELKHLKEVLRIGDIVGAEGHPGRTVKGELSLYTTSVEIIAPYVCSDQVLCPDLKGFAPVADNEIRYRYRFVDMISNPMAIQRFERRHAAVKALRNFLDARGFVEVETPVLHTVASGAMARPFVTHHNSNHDSLFLRVAPELHLKQCVVGGMDRVYEIGRVFRNEDADNTHNPEFTSCEFYAAYHTYEDLLGMTEDIVREMALKVNQSLTVSVQSTLTRELVEIDLSKPFRRVSVYDEIARAAGVELPPPTELHTPKGMAYMSAIMLRYNIPFPPTRTASKLFDKLIDFFITSRAVEPTFVMDHPVFMSPLAKASDARPGLSERFELFINGMEYCNAYSELNDPQEQYFRFQQQLLDRRTGDDEAMALDETFLKALQVGMPPTAGWGMGIDRMVMLLNGTNSIRDEIIFPLLRHDVGSHDAKRRRRTASFFGFDRQMTLFCLSALEEAMEKKDAPTDAKESVQQLRRCLLKMNTQHGEGHQDDEDLPTGWRLEVTAAVLRLFGGSRT